MPLRSTVECLDGFTMSVQASEFHHCTPRESGLPLSEYSTVEVGFPSERPEPWSEWEQYADAPEDPTETVYSWVPIDMVKALVESHSTPAIESPEEN